MSGTALKSSEHANGWHTLKCWPPFFADVAEGRKTFEVRKNDRGYRLGDVLDLREWTGTGYSGERFLARVVYVLDDVQFGLRDGYVVMGIEAVS
jgi:hypothetical protein